MSLATLLTALSPFTPIVTLYAALGCCFTVVALAKAWLAIQPVRFLSHITRHAAGAATMPLPDAVTFCGTGFTKLI